MKKIKHATTTSLVLEALRATQEFMSHAMLCRVTGRSVSRVIAALHHLRAHQAVDVVIENDGTGWWFATNLDDRQRVIEEIVPEYTKRPGRKRKLKAKPPSV